MLDVNNVNDWMFTLAEAVNNKDQETIENLSEVSTGWLQTSDERGAQLALLVAVSDLIYETA